MSFSKLTPRRLDQPPKCPLVLLLDTSSSMLEEENGKRRIDLLNKGLVEFQSILLEDKRASKTLDIAIVSFDSEIKLVTPFINALEFNPPALKAKEYTHMGEAIEYGLKLAQEKISEYQKRKIPCYQPVIFMITDGSPQYEVNLFDQDNQIGCSSKAEQKALEISTLIKELDSRRKLTFFIAGVGNADFKFLERITPDIRRNESFERLKKLGEANYTDIFVWITATTNAVTNVITNSTKS